MSLETIAGTKLADCFLLFLSKDFVINVGKLKVYSSNFIGILATFF